MLLARSPPEPLEAPCGLFGTRALPPGPPRNKSMMEEGICPHRKLESKRRSAWHLPLITLPTLFVSVLPKCPLCLMSITSVIGLGSVVNVKWLLPLMLVFLIIAVGMLAFRARHRRGYGPFTLGLAAALIILAGKIYFSDNAILYTGMVLLIAASVWNTWPTRLAGQTDCDCDSLTSRALETIRGVNPSPVISHANRPLPLSLTPNKGDRQDG